MSTPIRHRLTVPLALAGILVAFVPPISQTTVGQETAEPRKPRQTTTPKSATPAADANGRGTSDRFTATAVNFGRVNGETITVDVIRWSTDAEREKIVSTLEDKGAKELLAALQESPNLGYIWRSGSPLGSVVRYAYRWKAADGEHVVVATDSDLSALKEATTPASSAAAVHYPFTLIELVTSAAGANVGKLSLGVRITSDSQNTTIRLENYAAAPVTLKGVKRPRSASSRS